MSEYRPDFELTTINTAPFIPFRSLEELTPIQMALDLKRREYLSDLCYNSLKKCIVCAEHMKDCRPNCLEHAEILSNLIRGLMRDSPHIAQEMQLAIHGTS